MADEMVTSLETELDADSAAQEILKAVRGRRAIARKYVKWVRRRRPEASPAEIVAILERHYARSIAVAGAAISASIIAVDVGIALIPVAGAAAAGAKSAGQQAAKKAGVEATKLASKQAAKAATKAAAKGIALTAATGGAQRVAAMIPAGDEQLQFEITAIFALALAEIHGMELDTDQSHALVYGLSNGRVGAKVLTEMASDVASDSGRGVVAVGRDISDGRGDWSHWANTLADALPGGAAQDLVRTIQTGELNSVRETLSDRQQSAVEYGVAAVTGGVTRFVFGREVVDASRKAFAPPPVEFPSALQITLKVKESAEEDEDPNPAFVALKDAAATTGGWITGTASSVGSGVASAAASVSRPFRSVDLDGDGIADEPQALTAAKSVGTAISGTADRIGSGVAGLFASKRKHRADASVEEGDPVGSGAEG